MLAQIISHHGDFIPVYPCEIIDLVINQIDDRQTLLKPLLCSRPFYTATIRFLYRHITLLRCCFRRGTDQTFYPHVYDITCRLLRTPELAASIKSITVRWRRTTKERPVTRGVRDYDLDSSILSAIACDGIADDTNYYFQRRSNRVIWIEEFSKSRDSEAALAIILPFLPNPQKLNLWYGHDVWSFGAPFCIRVLERARRPGSGFPESALQRLEHVSIDSRMAWMHGEDLVALCLIPNLVKISIPQLGNSGGRSGWADLRAQYMQRSPSRLTHFFVEDSTLRLPDLLFLIQPCRLLRVLELAWSNPFLLAVPGTKAGFDTLDSVVLSISPTLEMLT